MTKSSFKNKTHIFKQAVQSFFKLFEEISEGAVLVDSQANISWLNRKYKMLLDLQGAVEDYIGLPVEQVIPNSMLRHVIENGSPILLDIMAFGKNNNFVVTRLPVFDERNGQVIGAVGFVLFNHVESLQPLLKKYNQLQSELINNRRELALHRRAKYSFQQIIGNSPAMQELKRHARHAARSNITILLQGPTGTGKELLAHAIHNASGRAQNNFVSVNTAAIPETLLESELFGVVPGAYTGASRQKRSGKFQLADGGTLFLDEIGDLPLPLQAKLLRVLQEREVEAVGSNTLEYVNVRVIAASSKNLDAMIEDGTFRADLYYRLNVMPLRLPALKDRQGDIPLLCEVLLEKFAIQSGSAIKELSESALDYLNRHSWPGNIRELQNLLERACTLINKRTLHLEDIHTLLPEIRPLKKSANNLPDAEIPAVIAQHEETEHTPLKPLQETLMAVERREMLKALQLYQGRRTDAAKALGISRAAFYERLKKHGL